MKRKQDSYVENTKPKSRYIDFRLGFSADSGEKQILSIPSRMERVDRQVRTIGAAAQKKISSSSILVVGLGGLGVECCKNLLLTGYKKIGIVDNSVVEMYDLGTQFFCSEEDVKKTTRYDASIKQLQSLNPTCEIVHESSYSVEVLLKYDCVVFTDKCVGSLVEENKICREKGIKFIAAETRGVFGCIFVDFGDSFWCVDTDGEKEAQGTINSITVDENGDVIVDVHDPDSQEIPNLKEGDVIKLINTEIPEMSGEKVIITRKNAVTLNMGKVIDLEKVKSYVGGGRYVQIKQKKEIKFKPLKDRLDDYKGGSDSFLVYDYDKYDWPQKILYGFNRLWSFNKKNKRLPKQYNTEDYKTMIKPEEKENYVDEYILKSLCYTAKGNLSPMVTLIGGLASQEVQKAVSGKYHPINQWFCFESTSCLGDITNAKEKEFEEIGCRYDSQIIVFGKQFQKTLGSQKYFLVGCGALGCEYLKGYAMTGLCTSSENGKFTITDLDEIETSNLSRQFLFRDKHVGRMKSVCAGEMVKEMNPETNLKALTDRVGEETEDVFNDKFWSGLDGIMNALDNLKARRYVDSKAVFYRKPLFESGTLGPKAHSQVIIPHKTINYGGQQDQQTNEFPECTIHVHPSSSQHTISWAKRFFNQTFFKSMEELGKFFKNPAKFIEENGMNMFAIETCFEYLIKNRPKKFSDCVVIARRKFEQYFNHSIKGVLSQHPKDEKTESGAPFWSGNKRCPTVIEKFGEEDTDYVFVESYSKLVAQFYKIEIPTKVDYKKICDSVMIEDYSPQDTKEEEEPKELTEEYLRKREEEEKELILKQRKYLSGLISQLKELKVDKSMLNGMEFEKDDPLHIEFVTAASNLRSKCYGIPQLTNYEVKGIAGNIIPAMVTTTAIATGLIMLEVYKYHQKKDITLMRNGFLNIAIPLVLLVKPMSAPKKILNTYNVWDRIFIQKSKDITVGKIVQIIEGRDDNVKVVSLSYGSCILLRPNMNPERLKKILAAPIKKLTEAMTKQKIKKNTLIEFQVGVTKDGKSLDEYLPIVYSIKVDKKLQRLLKKKEMMRKKKLLKEKK